MLSKELRENLIELIWDLQYDDYHSLACDSPDTVADELANMHIYGIGEIPISELSDVKLIKSAKNYVEEYELDLDHKLRRIVEELEADKEIEKMLKE